MDAAGKSIKWSCESKRQSSRLYKKKQKKLEIEIANAKRIEEERKEEEKRKELKIIEDRKKREEEERKREEEIKKQKLEQQNAKIVVESKQILRVKPLVELENPNKILYKPKSYLKDTVMQIVNPKSQPTEEKRYVVQLKSGLKFIGSNQPQYPNQEPKRIFLIRRPNQQIADKPQLFTVPEDPNPRKFVIKSSKGELVKAVNFVSQQTKLVPSTEAPVIITKTGTLYVKNSPKVNTVLNTVQKIVPIPEKYKQTPSTSRGKSYLAQKQVLMKEMILLEESRNIATPEPQMFQDPIDISDCVPKLEDPTVTGPQITDSEDYNEEPVTKKLFSEKQIAGKEVCAKISGKRISEGENTERQICAKGEKSAGILDPSVKESENPEDDPLFVGGLIVTATDEQLPFTSTDCPPSPTPSASSSNDHVATPRTRRSRKVESNSGKLESKTNSQSLSDKEPESSNKPEETENELAQCQQYRDFVDNMIFADLGNSTSTDKANSDSEKTLSEKNFDAEDTLSATSLEIVRTETCNHCNREFPSYKDLVKHWIELKNVCEICDVTLPFPFLLQMHLYDFHGIKGYKCSKCDYFDPSLWKLKLHRLRGHCLEYQYPCEDCDRAFSDAEALKSHVDRDHELQREECLCDFCGKGFNNHYTLQGHIRGAHQNKKYTCKQCGKSYKTRSIYGRHLQSHRTKKIVCEHCGKKFDLQSALKVHIRQHTGEKPYSCSICSKTFAKSNTLRQHLLIHSGKRPYVCDICGKTFTQKPGLTAHRKSHPGGLPNMPCLFIDEILKELPDDAFQNSRLNSGGQRETQEEAEVEDEASGSKDDENGAKSTNPADSGQDQTADSKKDDTANADDSAKGNAADCSEENVNLSESDGIETNFLAMVENEANILEMDANEGNIMEMVENENTVLVDILEQAINTAIEGEIQEPANSENVDTAKKGKKRAANEDETEDDPKIAKAGEETVGQLATTTNEDESAEFAGFEKDVTESKTEETKTTNTRPKRKYKKRKW